MCIKISANSNTTILEAIEAKGIEVHSECRDGYCGTCVCTLKSGEVEYVKEPLAYHDESKVVLCCAVAKTDVEISYLGSEELAVF